MLINVANEKFNIPDGTYTAEIKAFLGYSDDTKVLVKLELDVSSFIIQDHRYSADPYYMYTCHTKKVSCSNPKEIEKESLENYVISLIQKHCGLDDGFFEMPHDAPHFRYKLQDYIHCVTVNPKTVTVRIIVEGEVRTFRHGRKAFKTPKQRCFK